MSLKELHERYAGALDHLVERAEADSTLIGLYVYGSSVRGDIWRHSDIDAIFVSSDESRPWQSYCLVEDGIHVSAEVCSRRHFRRIHERSLRGSAIHSIFSSGRLLYAAEPTLQDYLDEAGEVGQRDLELLRMHAAIQLAGALHLAEKALALRGDGVTGFRRIILALEHYASLVILDRREPLCRDAIARSCELDSEYAALWRQAVEGQGDPRSLMQIHGALQKTLRHRAEELYKPLLDYLLEEREVRTATEIQRAVGERLGLPDVAHGIGMACDGLADAGLIQRTTMPVRLTRKGRVEFEEAAFFRGGERA